MDNPFFQFAGIALLVFTSVYLLVRYGLPLLLNGSAQIEVRLDRILNQQLLYNIHPRVVLLGTVTAILLLGLLGLAFSGSFLGFFIGVAIGCFLPWVVLRHLEQKRKQRLDMQLVDGIMTLASGVRAGLNLVQAMELLVTNSAGPIKQEFAQLLREYQLGLDLNQCMRNAANRIGSSHYRLLFTAIEMHRLRGGDTGESLDRIAESIREIQRLEGKLDALTAQGRTQASMMAAAPAAILAIYYLIDPKAVTMLFVEPMGRLMLLAAAVLIVIGFLWIRRIMSVDI